MKLIHIFTIALALLLLQSCTNPPYKVQPNEKTAHLKVLFDTTVSICTNQKVFDLTKKPKQNYLVIPADKRIDLSSTATYSGYQISYYCSPMLSFKPEEGKTYVLDLSVIKDRCVLDLAKEDTSTNTGLAPDLTQGPPNCFAH